MSYFTQTQLGESRWWSWVIATWLAFVCWIATQTILLLPMPIIAGITEPALFDAFMDAVNAPSGGRENASTYQSISVLTGLAATVAALMAIPAMKPPENDLGVFAEAEGPIDNPRCRKIGMFISAAILICFITSKMASAGSNDSELMGVFSELMAASPIIFALFLLTFPAGLAGIYLGHKLFHQRSLLSLHTAAMKFRWVRVAQGFMLTWIVLGGFAFAGNALGLMEVNYVFNGGRFWIYAAVSLLFIPLQSATEEIVFRGYFNQGLTHLLKSKWIAFILTSFAFMALHLSNPEALEGASSGTLPIVMSGYFFFGFAMCLVVWIDDGLETAIGIHAGNNCFAAVIMNYENSVLPTPSVFLTGSDPVKDSVSTFIILGVIVAIIWFWRGGPKNHDPSESSGRQSTVGA
jgi:membrane protease YdiL (CAAX protease family)